MNVHLSHNHWQPVLAAAAAAAGDGIATGIAGSDSLHMPHWVARGPFTNVQMSHGQPVPAATADDTSTGAAGDEHIPHWSAEWAMK